MSEPSPDGIIMDHPPRRAPLPDDAWGSPLGSSPTAPIPEWDAEPPPDGPPRRAAALWVVLGAAALGAALAGVFAVAKLVGTAPGAGGPLRTPAAVAGLRRVDSPALRPLLGQQERQLRDRGIRNYVVAAYGTGAQAQLVVVAVREAGGRTRGDIVKGFDAELARSVPGAGPDQVFEHGKVEYRCTASRLGASFSVCRWNDGDVVGFGFSPSSGPDRLSRLAA